MASSTSAAATLPLPFAAKLHNRMSSSSFSSSAWRCSRRRSFNYCNLVYAKALVSTDKGASPTVLTTEEFQDNDQTIPSSSKLFLLAGASGGVDHLQRHFLHVIPTLGRENSKIHLISTLGRRVKTALDRCCAGEDPNPWQLVAASLLQRNVKSRLILRDPEKATTLFGKHDKEKLQVYKADTRNQDDLDPSLFEGVTHVICCTGTTAFPSKRWEDDNTPERVDWVGVKNLVSALPSTVKRVVLVSSIGVTKSNELPWSIMNLFGVLKYKKMGEDFLRSSGLPYTIIRPGRLTDGPYTSYDLNTLLKATAGQRRAVLIGQGDKLVGEASRIIVAEACIQALDLEITENQVYEVSSVEGEGPGNDAQKWQELFEGAHSQ